MGERIARSTVPTRRRTLLLIGAVLVIAAACAPPPPTIERISFEGRSSSRPAISADGRWIAFLGSYGSFNALYLHDNATRVTTQVVSGDRPILDPAISADGRYLAFASAADDLVPGDTNGHTDLFTWDRTTAATTRITDGNGDSGAGDPGDSRAPALSGDGTAIAFNSDATDLVPGGTAGGYVWTRSSGVTAQVPGATSMPGEVSLSGDGRYLAFLGSGGLERLDRSTGVSAPIDSGLLPSISADGRYVAYAHPPGPDSVVHGFKARRWDAVTASTVEAPIGDGQQDLAARLSADGGSVTFMHLSPAAPGGVPHWDIDVWDVPAGGLTRVTSGNGASIDASTSADGKIVVFESIASDLVAGDTNATSDVYVWTRS